MKKNKIFNIAAGIALVVGATGCSSDYLDLHPEGTLAYDDVLTNGQGATLAVHGMCNAMYKQYSALYDYNWFNGEPWLSMYYGEVVGQDYISLFWFRSYPTLVNWTQMNQQGYGARIAWSYCYGLISQANNLLTYTPKQGANGEVVNYPYPEGTQLAKDENGNPIPDFSESENPEEYAFRYAQALTFRAHAYSRLMQIYAPRWDDRYNYLGEEKLTVPLRLEYVAPEGDLDCPLSPMSVVMDQIYADLYQAIKLYEQSGYSRSYDWEPDLQICKGIFARAALLKNDYKTAQTMAHDARQGYTIMSADDYLAGFAEPTSEWMWTNSGEAQGLYYASFGATYACNGAYPCLWGSIGAGAIDNELLKQANNRDRRGSIFFAPKNSLANSRYFWGDGCDSRTMNVNSSTSPLHQDFVSFAETQYNRVGKPNGWYPPYTYQGYPLNTSFTVCTAQFGAQFKFWGTDGYSSSFFPFMRASEMLLIEAEAAWQNGDENTSRQLINELNVKRFSTRNSDGSSYWTDITSSGDQLLDDIKLYRRLELWGEGFNWFDFKRWKEPIIRVAWQSGDTNSGNWPASVAGEYPVELNRGWRYRIPSVEYNYNHAIDQTIVNSNEDL